MSANPFSLAGKTAIVTGGNVGLGQAIALALADHVTANALGEEESGFEIGVDHRIPIVLGEIDGIVAADDAGIVHEDVDFTELGDRALHDAGDGRGGGEISFDRDEATAKRFHFRAGFFSGTAAG